MTDPRQFLVRIALFLGIVAAGVLALSGALVSAFMANPALNGMIVAALLIGIIFIVRQLLLLRPEVAWVEEFRAGRPAHAIQRQPRLLAPIATMLGERRDLTVSLSATSMRSLLDSLDSRLAESRDLSRYLIGLLIFLGLLGTFWGLLGTVDAIGTVINDLTIEGGDLGMVFSELKRGLESPLSGMATAFSSSLLGLAGSLVLGFLDLQLGQAQNRFYNDLEEWLSGSTRLGAGGGFGDGETSASAYQSALFEQTAESLDRLQRVILRSEDDRRAANTNLLELNETLSTLLGQMQVEQGLMLRIGEAQMELKPVLDLLVQDLSQQRGDRAIVHLRNIEALLVRQQEEVQAARVEAVDEIRQEIRLLARTIAALAEEDR